MSATFTAHPILFLFHLFPQHAFRSCGYKHPTVFAVVWVSVYFLVWHASNKRALTEQSLRMVTKPTHPINVWCNMFTVCLLHVSVSIVAILGEAHYKGCVTKVSEPVHKCKALSPLYSHFSIVTNTELFVLYFVGPLVGSCTPLPPPPQNCRPLKSRQIWLRLCTSKLSCM